MCSCETGSPASSGHSWSMRLNMSHMCPLWPLLCTESTQSTKSRSICFCSAPPRTTTTPAPATARAQSRGWAAQTSNSAPRHGSYMAQHSADLKLETACRIGLRVNFRVNNIYILSAMSSQSHKAITVHTHRGGCGVGPRKGGRVRSAHPCPPRSNTGGEVPHNGFR